MGMPAAKQMDQIVGTDTHIVMIPSPGGPVPTPLPHPFMGIIDQSVSTDVFVGGMGLAMQGSKATNTPPHIPQGGPFQSPPSNQGEVMMGSATVFVNGKPAARNGDTALTCNDPTDMPVGTVVAAGTVFIG
ncbi:MAG: PAAR domain-containing protein [Pseudomonadota bacterium]